MRDARWFDDPGREMPWILSLADELASSRPLLHMAIYPSAMRAAGDEPSALHRTLAHLGYVPQILGGDSTDREEWVFSHPDGTLPSASWDEIAYQCRTDKASWHHDYMRRYEVRMEGIHVRSVLEIGVDVGNSLRAWAEIWPDARVCGVDHRPECAKWATDRIEVVIGDATDADSIGSLLDQTWDLIVDDGSHQFPDQKITAELLIPSLAPGGCYIIEDVPWNVDLIADVEAVLADQGLWPVSVIRSGALEHAALLARARP